MKENLFDEKNYNKELNNEDSSIYISKFIELTNNYIHYIVKNINIAYKDYNKYIIIKGLETLKHIYILLLTYTKNIDMVMYYCQKSYCYYVEFIEQMNNGSDIIKLNSKDAVLFMYRKTLYEINQNYRKENITLEEDKLLLDNTYKGINNYLCLLESYIDKEINEVDSVNGINNNIPSISLKIIKLFNKIVLNKNSYLEILIIISNLIKYLFEKKISIERSFELLELIIQKMKKTKLNIEKIENNIENNEKLENINNINNNILINLIIDNRQN